MRKITLFLFGLFCMVSMYAQEYCKAEGSRSTGDRTFSKFEIAGGTLNGEKQVFENTFALSDNARLYHDRTEKVIEVSQGDELRMTITHQTIWMDFYGYIDFNQDKVFAVTEDDTNEMVFELVHSAGGILAAKMPAIKIPVDAPLGKTRLRFKSEWASTDPCGNAALMAENRGIMIDYSINVNPRKTISTITVGEMVNGTIELSTTEGVIQSGAEVPVGTEVTINAIPAAGYKLNKLMINGVEKTENKIKVGAQNIVVTASFMPENANILTITPALDGDIAVALVDKDNKETAVANGEFVTNGSTLKVTFTPKETFLFKSAKVNEEDVTASVVGNVYTFTMNAATTISAMFKKDPNFLEYCLVAEKAGTAVLKDTYLESITTTGTITNVAFTNSSRTFYTNVGTFEAVEGKSFTLNLKARNLGEYSEAAPKQDLRYTIATMFIDWNQDGRFSSDEGVRLAGKMASEGLHAVGGNVDVLNIAKEIEVKLGVVGKYRIRVIYNNAWETSPLTKGCGSIKEGVVYDMDMIVKTAICPVTLVQPSKGEGSFKVMNGEEEVKSGDAVMGGTKLTVVPTLTSDEYELRSVLVNGKPIEGLEFVIAQETEISLDVIKGRVLSYSSTLGGILSITDGTNKAIESGAILSKGSTIKVKTTPDAGYHVLSVMVNGEDKTAACSSTDGFTFQLNETMSIEAAFEINTYPFNFSFNSELGRVTVFDEGKELKSGDLVEYGHTVSVTANPLNDQCYLKSLKLNGIDKKDELLPNNKRTFELVVEEVNTVAIEFAAVQFTLTCNTPKYGTLEIKDASNKVYKNGDTVSSNSLLYVTLTGDKNELASLLINDGVEELDYVAEEYVEKNGNVYTTDLTVGGNVSITATFTKPVSVESLLSNSVKVYINHSGNAIIEGAQIGSNVKIYNITGQLVLESIVSNTVEAITLPHSNALYLIKIANGSQTIVKKLSK